MTNYCILGDAGSGKDTVGKIVAEILGKETYALAAPIKDLVAALFGLTEETMNGRAHKEKKTFLKVTPNSLRAAGEVYKSHGLWEYQDFPDAWQQWIDDLGLTLEPWGHYEGWYSPRDIFQYIGTEWGRGIDDEIWIKKAPDNVVITDVRLYNEADFFFRKGWEFIHVVRPNVEKIEGSGHITEQGVNHPLIMPITIRNDGGIRDLGEKVETLLRIHK